jgi:hypothetical protein
MSADRRDPISHDEPWMSHHNGRVTGTKVSPGQGDAEAGLSSGEPRGVQADIADADKKARVGTASEEVRSTPPAGKWNETSPDS